MNIRSKIKSLTKFAYRYYTILRKYKDLFILAVARWLLRDPSLRFPSLYRELEYQKQILLTSIEARKCPKVYKIGDTIRYNSWQGNLITKTVLDIVDDVVYFEGGSMSTDCLYFNELMTQRKNG